MRKVLLCFLLSLSAATVLAQSKGTINGTVIDQQKEGIVGAVLELTSLRDTLQKKYTTTAIRGAFQFKSVPEGKYRISSSSLGYKDSVQMISVAGGKTLDMPAWVMEEDAKQIDAVSVTTQAVRTTINGDTIVYNASAYKVMPDADTDG